jgi:aminopeptidase-like protein
VRQTLARLAQEIPLEIHEVPSGTKVFDWTIPLEWNVRDAYIKNGRGERVVDFNASSLHVLNYSTPVRQTMSLAELKEHLFTLPDQPDAIPYRTSYYEERWGFCLTHDTLEELHDGTYEVYIDSELKPGSLTYGEYLCPGESEEEILLSAHICHPSLANDNCSGLALLTHLARAVGARENHFSYRFLFAPGTIGSIAWLAANEERLSRIKGGLVVSCVGDGGGPTYKESRQGNAEIDRVMKTILRERSPSATVLEFSPYGYDERQFCSPGFNLPIGLFQRSQFGQFPEYHNSRDNLSFIAPEHLEESYRLISETLQILDGNYTPISTNPKCEPQFGRRNLYSTIGGAKESAARNMALFWVMNLADGRHSLLDIAERAKMSFWEIAQAAERLHQQGLIVTSRQ